MGGASRLILLLTTPFSLLHPRSRTSVFLFARHSRLSLATTCHPTTTISLIPIKASQQIHTQTTNKLKDDHHFGDSFSSELYSLIHTLSAAGYSGGYENHPDDAYAYLQLQNSSQEFLRLANACLSFARNQPNILGNLSRKDIQVIVENGTPFLFKSALDNARRMRSFLHSAGTNVLESDKAQTVDLMKYLLSYASNPTSESNNLYCREIVQSSVRNLMSELVEISSRVPVSGLSAPAHRGVSGSHGHPPRPFGQNIQMKRGDWICPKCSFMNFARNVKCIECEETRPKRQITSGEWECPQCDFYNYGKNMVCLRCDCKRPDEASFGTTVNSMPDFGHNNGDYANKAAVDRRLDASKEKAQQWFSKVSQKLKNASALSGSAVVEEDFPEILSSRKGGNRFVVSPRKTPLETRVSNSDYQTNLGNDGMPEDDSSQTGGANKTPLDESVNRSLDQIFGHASSVSGTNINKSITTGQNDAIMNSTPPARYGIPKGRNSSHVPFVPLPADMFAKKLTTEEDSVNEVEVTKSRESVSSITRGQTDTVSAKDESEEPASQDKDRGEEAIKSERWFKRVAELHCDDVKDLENAISDEDFPEIMPIRKGENRFVISSKKKDRSLTSSMYKPEQLSNAKFVPFVPFPPNYFAKNEKQLSDGPDSSVKSIDETSSGSSRHPEESRIGAANNINYVQNRENQESGNRSSKFSVDFGEPSNAIPPQNSFSSQTGPVISGNPTPNFPTSQTSRSNDSWGGSRNSSWKGKTSQSWEPPSGENSQIMSNINSSSSSGSGRYSGTEKKLAGSPPEKQQINSDSSSGWMGKSSLEGSAVKEPDPLDMSEEAKAERWFRRVAQIKDISELSQIPDEDFPSIMPMRKGVNRFVVSKRKTPLERRLTSPQYRRNLPVVSSSDLPPPVNKEND